MPFEFKQTAISEVKVIESRVFPDPRGYYLELFKESAFREMGVENNFKQDSISFSKKGVLRGLHFQKPPYAQKKLVSVAQGEIWDVAVDMRKNSKTFGKWAYEKLSAENGKMLYIPEGFAHGFCVLSETATIVYKMSKEYAPESEGGVLWSDLGLKIDWPVKEPLVSEKDSLLPEFKNAYYF